MNLKDLFGRDIKPGDSFLRIENQMGGARLRYYFYGGPSPERGRIHVQEYGGAPRVINNPSCTLVLLTEDLLALSKLTPPKIEDVTAPPTPKKTATKKAAKSGTMKL